MSAEFQRPPSYQAGNFYAERTPPPHAWSPASQTTQRLRLKAYGAFEAARQQEAAAQSAYEAAVASRDVTLIRSAGEELLVATAAANDASKTLERYLGRQSAPPSRWLLFFVRLLMWAGLIYFGAMTVIGLLVTVFSSY
ncbi:MAG: hypothetical protein GEEBNDBF_00257 [bacterium]|nr:hypothetical protein [bacterium]